MVGVTVLIVCSSVVLFLSFLQTTAPIRARVLYERLVTFFPTSGRYWRLYIEQEVTSTPHSLHDLCPRISLPSSVSCCAPVNYILSVGVCCQDNQSINILRNLGQKKGRMGEKFVLCEN